MLVTNVSIAGPGSLRALLGDAILGGRCPCQDLLLGIDQIYGQRALLVVDRLNRGGSVDSVIPGAIAIIAAGVSVARISGRARRRAHVLLVLNVDVEIEQQIRAVCAEYVAFGFHRLTRGVFQVLCEQRFIRELIGRKRREKSESLVAAEGCSRIGVALDCRSLRAGADQNAGRRDQRAHI